MCGSSSDVLSESSLLALQSILKGNQTRIVANENCLHIHSFLCRLFFNVNVLPLIWETRQPPNIDPKPAFLLYFKLITFISIDSTEYQLFFCMKYELMFKIEGKLNVRTDNRKRNKTFTKFFDWIEKRENSTNQKL